MLYVKDVAGADRARRERRHLPKARRVKDDPAVRSRGADWVGVTLSTIAMGAIPLEELVEGELVVNLVAKATVALHL